MDLRVDADDNLVSDPYCYYWTLDSYVFGVYLLDGMTTVGDFGYLMSISYVMLVGLFTSMGSMADSSSRRLVCKLTEACFKILFLFRFETLALPCIQFMCMLALTRKDYWSTRALFGLENETIGVVKLIRVFFDSVEGLVVLLQVFIAGSREDVLAVNFGVIAGLVVVQYIVMKTGFIRQVTDLVCRCCCCCSRKPVKVIG